MFARHGKPVVLPQRTPLYLFLTPPSRLPNRNLTPAAPSLRPHNRRTDMSDFIFLALGCGTFVVFAAYARALDRL